MKCVGARHATEPGDTCASSNQCEVTDVRGSLQNIKDLATARAREKDGLWKGRGYQSMCQLLVGVSLSVKGVFVL